MAEIGTNQPQGLIGHGDLSKALEIAHQENELLQMKIAAQAEIIAAYRDSLECFQNEKRLASALHMADLSQLTKPKT